MPLSVNEIIYQAFFERLEQRPDINPETVKTLKALNSSNLISNKNQLAKLAQEIETRHVPDENTHS